MRGFICCLFLFCAFFGVAQSYNIKRANWEDAGYRGVKPVFTQTVNILSFGGDNSGSASNNAALTTAISSLSGMPGVIYFPAGTYLFSNSVSIAGDSLLFLGDGHDQTTLQFNMSGTLNNCINVYGTQVNADTTSLAVNATRDSGKVDVVNASSFQAGQWIYLTMNDSDLLYSSWAYGSVGQIMQIQNVSANTLTFKSPFRYTYPVSRKAKIKRLVARNNVGFECLKIKRMDATTFQTSLISFDKAVNCWANGIEGDSTNYSHIELNRSSNIEITNSYFHHGFSYGSSGQAYGITFQYSSGECKAEGNIFMHLRHSLLMQAGANGNVCAYNFSFDPYWTQQFFPTNAAGELVLHGNFVFSNLFEGNVCQNIVVDDSHAKNGPYNTFYRNRASLYGFYMNNSPATDTVQIVANEITNGLYTIAGNGHLQYGNYFQGAITPNGTNGVTDTSLYLTGNEKPLCMGNGYQWPAIGLPTAYFSGTNEAFERYQQGVTAQCSCTPILLGASQGLNDKIYIYPNPAQNRIYVSGLNLDDRKIFIFDIQGTLVKKSARFEKGIDISGLKPGVYFLKTDPSEKAFKFIKME